MRTIVLQCFLIISVIIAPGILYAQGNGSINTDTLKQVDSAGRKFNLPLPVINIAGSIQGKANALDPSKQVTQVKSQMQNAAKQADAALSKSLEKIKSKSVSYSLSVQDAVDYQPGASIPGVIYPDQRFVNTVTLQGMVQAFGIPLNLNYTNNQTAIQGLSGVSNNLFKFDFNPAQFAGMFKSDLQQYYDLRRNSFGGQDLAGYARTQVMSQLRSQQSTVAGVLPNTALTQYLNKPANINGLLSLNEDQIKQKLTAIAQDEAKKQDPVKELNNINTADPLAGLTGVARTLAKQKLLSEEAAMKGLSTNPAIQKYLSDPANLQKLKMMNEQQIEQKLTSLASQPSSTAAAPMPVINTDIGNPMPKVSISGYVNTVTGQKAVLLKTDIGNPMPQISIAAYINSFTVQNQADKDAALKKLAHRLFVAGQAGKLTNSTSSMQALSSVAIGSSATVPQASQLNAATASNTLQTNKQIDSVAHTITGIKDELQKNGVDVNKMLQIQTLLNSGNGNMPPTELASSLMTRKPTNSLQSLFSNVQALKIGSFGNQVPGGTQSQDMFISGTHVTYKFGTIPVTAGYGSSNDISSAKDVTYQNSVYSAPKSITYLGAQIKRGVFGNVKIAVVSSFGSSNTTNNTYATSTTSSNNVAFTITKDMKAGKLGDISVDVSKSTTLYNNNYQIGSDAIIAQKAGVNVNTANDLFQALGFNINQHLDIKALDMSDNVYFNYAGMGYQNPGNNGYGGARKKLGGNIKKSFNKNKLTFNLRSDISAMPTSYTTSDQWRSYQVQLDSKYAISKKFNMGLTYSTNATSQQVAGVVTPIYSFQKLQVDGNVSYKIGKNFTVSHFSIGKQDYSNTLSVPLDNSTTTGTTTTTGTATAGALSPAASSLLTATYTQSMVMGKNSLTATMFYNKELTAQSLIGNMFNSDVSYQYQLFNKISMSSGLTYLDNAGIAEQAGIRQSVQLFSTRSFDMSTYVDINKNLITSLYPDLYSTCRAELSLKYRLKN